VEVVAKDIGSFHGVSVNRQWAGGVAGRKITFSHYQLILGARRVADAVVCLDKLAWWSARIGSDGVARWWW
jgi:hypothetical protein